MENYFDSPLKLLVCIVNRDDGEKVTAILRQHGIYYSMIFLGTGACDSKWMNLLCLDDIEKDIVLSLGGAKQTVNALSKLNDYLELSLPGNGIAFSIPLRSIDKCALNFLGKLQNEVK